MFILLVEDFHVVPLGGTFESPHHMPVVTDELEDVLCEELVTFDGAEDSVEVALVLYLHAVKLDRVHGTGSCSDDLRLIFENANEFTPRRHL